MTPVVSVILPAYNCAETVGAAVRSWAAQSQRGELIAVDDGSSDGTGVVLERLAADHADMRVVRRANGGVAAARNTGLALARAPFICFLDADDRLLPDALTRLRRAMEGDPSMQVVFPRCRWVDVTGACLDKVSPDVGAQRFFGVDLLRDNPIHTDTGVMLRRAAAERAGGFDERMPACVGIDFWARAAGEYGVRGLNAVLVEYRQRPGQITADWRRLRIGWEIAADKLELSPATRTRARAQAALVWSWRAEQAGDRAGARQAVALIWRNSPGFALRTPAVWRRTIACGLPSARP